MELFHAILCAECVSYAEYYIPWRGLSALFVSSTRAMRRPSSSGMDKENPTFPFYGGLTLAIS